MSIVDEIKASFKQGSTLTKLIYINGGIFVIAIIWQSLVKISGSENIKLTLAYWLTGEADIIKLLSKPWSVFTYMFLHLEFLHFLFNMLMLFWFGRIFLRYLTQKQLLTTYILGGLCGILLHITFYNMLYSTGPGLLGASASVMAILVAISFYAPNYTINLLFIGPVKLKYIALISIFLDVVGIASFDNIGHLAHLGGAFYGYIFAMQYKKGREIGRSFSRFLDSLFSMFKPNKKMKVTYKKPVDDYEYNKHKAENQKEIDRILDKIANSGYKSLTKKEKETLFKMSKDS